MHAVLSCIFSRHEIQSDIKSMKLGILCLQSEVFQACPDCAMQGVPHVPPAESSDEEPEPEEDALAAELSQEQPEHQQEPTRVEGRIAQGAREGQVAGRLSDSSCLLRRTARCNAPAGVCL